MRVVGCSVASARQRSGNAMLEPGNSEYIEILRTLVVATKCLLGSLQLIDFYKALQGNKGGIDDFLSSDQSDIQIKKRLSHVGSSKDRRVLLNLVETMNMFQLLSIRKRCWIDCARQ